MTRKPPAVDPPAHTKGPVGPEHSPSSGTGKSAPDANVPVTREMILSRFIRLCSSVFSTPNHQEAAAIAVNRISELVRTDRAVLVRLQGRNPITAVTGGGPAAQDGAFADAVETVKKRYKTKQQAVLVPAVSEEKKNAAPHLWKFQQAMGGTQILWLPLWLSRDDSILPSYALWLERWNSTPWEASDIELLQHAALFLGHGLKPSKEITRSQKRWTKRLVGIALLIFLCLPVTASVTTPARVMPDHPLHIFAPMDGILKTLHVQPGQWVEQDAVLFSYDSRVLDKRLDEAYRSIAVAKAKLVRLQGAAYRDPEARADLPVQKLEVKRAEADARFFEKQRARADVKTVDAGVIVLDDPEALIGAALQTGQAVMSIADPARTQIRLMVPASDVGLVKKDALVSVRLDSDPLKNYSAIITRVGFDIRIPENQVPSVLAEAMWVDDAPDIRPGQRGTAKIMGKTSLMGMQLMRRPFIALRKFIGF